MGTGKAPRGSTPGEDATLVSGGRAASASVTRSAEERPSAAASNATVARRLADAPLQVLQATPAQARPLGQGLLA